MGEVSKLMGGGEQKWLPGRELGEFDSVNKMSILGDIAGGKLRVEG